ncbi:putative ATPase [Rivularia sp. PCC 7116]|uniref:trifunctional serine/threonine-protein kinase/ATP-binding protein/sensor histidine kinase n=1 Tax=Rivularia sp. PCC 7116 TaxID=373994 RepID=UPI00029EC72C|nr:ATP-binding sensor histidine kinase [Rivularia sp. PCC 7116]AFY58456.1 putative ATPase [Rivularia sp. PCC 7116]
MANVQGYQIIEEIYNGLRTIIYRALREEDRKPVVIKLLKNPYPDFNEILQFRNQYTITKNINYPIIIKTYSLEAYQNGYALVMEDMGGISLKKYFNTLDITSLEEFLQIAITLCETLNILAKHRIIHKDIKPANILINPETKQVKLIDFSIASLLPKETQEIKNPNSLEGTLAYISPEQTGRMNRGVDYRSDFYSLGVTFYELLTGELPFNSDDAMELLHCHIAKNPPELKKLHLSSLTAKRLYSSTLLEEKPHPNPLLVREREQEIPLVISDIVMKLMAKNAEDRYQSALGLKCDLEKCLYQLKETGSIEKFEIAQRDICDKFIIPEKLYGREHEVEQLLAAFERVSQANCELMLVAGFSGIGKTAVINEVHKPIVKQRGYFIKGKFDQFNRNIPLDAFVQAFRGLMGQLLSESDAQLSSWKNKVLQALGDNAQVIIDVIPELENIIGKQPAVPEISGIAAQNRFNLLFQKFIQVFSSKEHPLVIFLDDLQWADSASLKLMQLLLGESKINYLLIIGAYRDNEVSAAHPLMLTLSEITKAKTIINTITLAALNTESLNKLIADTLNYSVEIAQTLTQLVYQKTQGNPFFSRRILKALYEDNLIVFDFDTGSWVCDINKVRAAVLTDDVVEFMALQLQKLPSQTLDILKLAACIGNQFDLATLAIVCQKSETETAADLWKALQDGLIVPQSQVYKFYIESEIQISQSESGDIANYKFLHDRVQQAAYSLIPQEQKKATHYNIGQLLLEKIPLENREDRIFELVNQLNYGTDLITEKKERTQLAKLNLIACRKAKSAVAYQVGREYGNIGLLLLGENAWEQQYQKSLAFHNELAELASLCGDFTAMEELIETVTAQTTSLIEQVDVYRIRILVKTSQNKATEAIAIALQFLQKLNITFPETPTLEYIQETIIEVYKLIGDREIADLANLPIMTDEEKIAIIQIANSIMAAAFISGSPLLPLLVALSVKLSIQYGNIPASAFAYAAYGIIACNQVQDVETGVKFGHLALGVISKLDAKAVKPEILSVVGEFILHRKSHVKEILPLLQEGYGLALEVGNLDYVGYNTKNLLLNSFWCSQPLDTLEQKNRTYLNSLVQLNQATTANWCRIYRQAVLNLLGFAEHPSILSGEALQEAEFIPRLLEAHDLLGLYFFYLYKLMLCYLFGEIQSAQEYTIEVRRYFMAGAGTIGEPAFYLYDSLTALASLNSQSANRAEILQRVEENQIKLQQQWANYAPMNHQHKVDLVEAEKCRVLGQTLEAIELYDKAISGAKANAYTQEEALANELAGKFCLDWGKEKFAALHMQEAYYCYARWGAKAKTDDLEKRYPQLLTPILQNQNNNFQNVLNTSVQTIHSSHNGISEALNFSCIIKASQALSSEIQLEQLISRLMKVVMEHAGAKKVALLLLKNENIILEALTDVNQKVETLDIPYQDSKDIPITIVNYVKRSLKTVLLDDATTENEFVNDSYLIEQQPKSVLCMPILNRGQFIGLLYLENRLTIGAFTQHHLKILNLIVTQAAISLENAELYSRLSEYSCTLKQKVEERTQQLKHKATRLESALQELQCTQTQLVQAEKMSGLGQLVAGIAHEFNNPVSFIYCNITPANEYVESLIELINLYKNLYSQPVPEIEEKIEEIELCYLIQDLPKLLFSMKKGAKRIKEIVLSLRNFSRLDESEIKSVNIHDGIESTLLILQHKLSSNNKYPEIEIIKKYSQLPEVKCYASELNQVFINIISNAIDALRDKKINKPTITIMTSVKDSQNIFISIADNGIGMNKSVLNKIFDPFFTTKPVGSGTGLGLSTSYSIVVEKHGGKLNCVSTLGEGTEFVIELPIKLF